MDISNRTIKNKAYRVFRDNIGTAILAMLLVAGINLAGHYLASALFAGTDILNLILYQVFLFILSLITAVFSAGQAVLYLHMAREQESSIQDLLYFFRNHPDRVIVAAFVLSLISLAVNIPADVYGYTAVVGTTMESQLQYLMTSFIVQMACQIVYILITLPFSMTWYLLSEDPGRGGSAALKESMKMMRGVKKQYLLLLISFIPGLVLSVIALYIPLLFVIPHMNLSKAAFYDALREQLSQSSPETKLE